MNNFGLTFLFELNSRIATVMPRVSELIYLQNTSFIVAHHATFQGRKMGIVKGAVIDTHLNC